MKQAVKRVYLWIRKLLLYLFAALIPKPVPKVDPEISNILFVRIDRIGDMVLSTPAIKALKQAYPQAELTVLASPSNKDILMHNPYVDHVIVYDRRLRLRERWGVIRYLQKIRFDLAVDPYADYELRTALIVFLSGAFARIGYGDYGREVFFNIEAPRPWEDQPFIDITLEVFKPLGIECNDRKPEIYLNPEELNRAQIWLRRSGIGLKKPLIGVHPGAYYESQRWPAKNFAELIDRLHADGKADVLLFGGSGDDAICQKIQQKAGTPVPSFVTESIREFSALLASCQLLVCNNSGPLHMAVALNVPTVSTMGPTRRSQWMPAGEVHKVFRMDHLPCIGCNLGYCKARTHDCMRLITPGMIKESIYQSLSLRLNT